MAAFIHVLLFFILLFKLMMMMLVMQVPLNRYRLGPLLLEPDNTFDFFALEWLFLVGIELVRLVVVR